MNKQQLKKEYYEKINARNILVSQNVIVNENNINTFLTFFNATIKQENIKQYDNVLKYISELSIHKRYTNAIIKSIASNTKHFCNKSCLDIVNSGYTQHILEDLEQNVFIALLEMANNNKVWLEDNSLVFDTYINSNDKETSYFVKLYRVIENTFYSEKKQTEDRYKKIKYDKEKHGTKAHFNSDGYLCDKFGNAYLQGCKMEYLDSYNDDTTSTNSNDYRQFLYSTQQENSLYNVAYREDIKQLFSTIKKEYPKYYSDFCGIFECLYKGYTYKETSDILGINERRIKYLIPLLRDKYNDILVNGITLEKQVNTSLYCDTTRNKGTTYYINRTKTTFVTPTIKKVQVQENVYNHTPNYDYAMPQYILDKWAKEEQEQRIQLLNNVTQHINVIDKKNKCIVILNQNGEKLYSMPLHTRDYVKFARKHKLEIL